MKILITGQSGVGKSTLLNKYAYFSVDDQTKKVWGKRGGIYYNYIQATFGSNFVNKNAINYPLLGQTLFANPQALARLNRFVVPIIREWIRFLPPKSIVEFAQYLNLPDQYQELFDVVILVKHQQPNLDRKFTYLKNKHQPVADPVIKADYVLDNTHFDQQVVFDQILTELLSN